MLTEDEKWSTIYDDDEMIALLKMDGETPESSSGLTTEEIEKAYEKRKESLDDGNYSTGEIVGWLIAGGAAIVFVIGCAIKKHLDKKKKSKEEES